MSDKATLSEIREAYVRPQGLFGHYGAYSRGEDFDAAIAEVERAAAEKAWWSAESAFGQAHDQDHLDPWSHMPVNPYRAATLGLTAGQEGEKE